ncbi:hypothetical protein JHK87_030993 [Glycine soja]|nr:hypothetical protein JHK87_030993 [Glycine soja]
MSVVPMAESLISDTFVGFLVILPLQLWPWFSIAWLAGLPLFSATVLRDNLRGFAHSRVATIAKTASRVVEHKLRTVEKLHSDYDFGHTLNAKLLPRGESSVSGPVVRLFKPFNELFDGKATTEEVKKSNHVLGKLEKRKQNPATEEVKKSNHVLRKLEKRKQNRVLDPHIEEQFRGGRLLA